MRVRDIFVEVRPEGGVTWGVGQGSMGGGYSTSRTGPEVVSPFGGLPYQMAHGIASQFARPLEYGFGLGNPSDPRYQKFQGQIDQGQGPLADYIRNVQGFLPDVFGQAKDVGANIASKAPALYDQFQGQVNSLLSQLPNFQRLAGENTTSAENFLKQSESPVQSNALTANALRNTLQQTRGAAAGRGLLDAGTTQASEENIAQNLYQNAAQNQFQNQQQALAGAGNALGQQVGIQGAGIDPAAQAFGALQPLAQALSAQYNIPMDALNQVFALITGGQAPGSQLLGQTSPVVAQHGRSKGFQQSASGGL